ncbi:YugN-like family protein [Oceanobacillus limi]|uniref:YugN-like family protein n=1 Tax=Oceanobacillus limi TaxID=930131 RepID=A0A1I0B929_9BACI|nr:YugN family protein [Oceanobacillus limi]SET03281.1 YugN-like family protein [Oceanobacillus limi]
MLQLETNIEGKTAHFADMMNIAKHNGFGLCGSWEYDGGFFDSIIWREGGETIYVRVPFHVIKGELDRPNALLQFKKPFVIKHVVHIGLDQGENSLLAATGINQFQEPLDKDGQIHNKTKWEEVGQMAVNQLAAHVPANQSIS